MEPLLIVLMLMMTSSAHSLYSRLITESLHYLEASVWAASCPPSDWWLVAGGWRWLEVAGCVYAIQSPRWAPPAEASSSPPRLPAPQLQSETQSSSPPPPPPLLHTSWSLGHGGRGLSWGSASSAQAACSFRNILNLPFTKCWLLTWVAACGVALS